MAFFWQSQQWYQKTEILAMVFFGRQSSGIEKPKFWQWFFRQNSSGIKEPKLLQWFFFGRHSSGIKKLKLLQWFFFADIAVVSKNRNFGNGFFFWQTQQWYQNIEILAIFFFFCRYSSGIKKPKLWQWFFFICISRVIIETLIHSQ